MPSAALRALLAGSIDYAGLFPPATLELDPAIRNYAEYARSPEAWMLNAFVLPVAEFDVASEKLELFDRTSSFRISALGAKADDTETFLSGLRSMADAIRGFTTANHPIVQLAQIEMSLPANAAADTVAKAAEALRDFGAEIFLEASPAHAAGAISLIARHNGSHDRKIGYKLRTGGTSATAFPTVEQVAGALFAATQHNVPIKFTAGLHHPVRRHDETVQTKMHGFLNVFGAGVLAVSNRLDEKRLSEILSEEDPARFQFGDDGVFRIGEWTIGAAEIENARKMITSFGSCSFDEPRDDLRALGLL